MVRRSVPGVIAACVLAAALVGCSDDPDTTSDTTASTVAVSSTTTSESAPMSTTSAEAPTTTASRSTGAAVDLAFTGTLVFAAKGSNGACATTADTFDFEANAADYQALGESFKVTRDAAGVATITFAFGSERNYVSDPTATITFSDDLKSVTIEGDLVGVPTPARPDPGTVHVAGTITCP